MTYPCFMALFIFSFLNSASSDIFLSRGIFSFFIPLEISQSETLEIVFFAWFWPFSSPSRSKQKRYGGTSQPFFNPLGMGYPKHQLSSKSETLEKSRFFCRDGFFAFSPIFVHFRGLPLLEPEEMRGSISHKLFFYHIGLSEKHIIFKIGETFFFSL